jgi:transposase
MGSCCAGDPAGQTRRQPSPCRRTRSGQRLARSTLYDYFDLWSYDGTLDRLHEALYVKCREQAGRDASPTAAILDSQSVKSAEKGAVASTRMALMQARRSKARSGISSSIRKAC